MKKTQANTPASLSNFNLWPHQVDGIDNTFEDWAGDCPDALVCYPTGCGKAQPVDELVLTPQGWVKIGSLEIGDCVIGSDGKPTQVTGIFPQGVLPVYQLEISDGTSVLASGEHLWQVQTKFQKYDQKRYKTKEWSIKTTLDLMDDLLLDDGSHKWYLPDLETIEFEPGGYPTIDPYVLGVLLGDGYIAPQLSFSSKDQFIIDKMSKYLEGAGMIVESTDYPGHCDYVIVSQDRKKLGRSGHPFRNTLRQLGLWGKRSHEKFIPDTYKFSGVATRLRLLHGLMDTDGSACKGGRAEFYSTSKQLAEDVAEIVRSLNGYAKVHPKQTSCNGKLGKPSYRVAINTPILPFSLPRKAERYNTKNKFRPRKAITDIYQIGEAECVCIKVEAPDELYVTNGYNLTHNTRFFCAVATLVWEPGKRILVLAHTEELVDQPRAVFEQFFCPQHPEAKLGTVRAQQREYKADIVFATVQTLSQDGYKPLLELLKHGQIDILIIDETHHILAETYLGLKDRLKGMAGWERGIEQLEAVRTWIYETFPEEMEAAGKDDERKQAVLMHKEKLERKQARWAWMANHHFEGTNINPNLLTLGVTATPYRTDNISLGNCFPRVMERDRFTYCLTIRQAIALKLLAPIRPSELQTKIEANDKLVDLWAAGDWADLLINHWLEVCGEKHLPTLAFMPDILTSKSLIKHLGEKHGIVGGHVDGEVCYLWNNEAKELEKIDRKTLIEKFKAREFCFLSNYGVLTEGVDFPFLEVEIIARPTQSRTAYVQMLGRVLRLDQNNPEKVANIIHVGFQGMALVDYTSVTGEMLSEEMEAIEKAFAMLTVEGHAAIAPPCPSCQGPLKRIRGTRDYQCELCLNMFTGGKDVDDHIPDILDPTKPSGKGAYAKYISLFVEDVVAWYREDGFYSVSIGVGGRNGDEAERTLLIAPPGVIPRRPDGHSLIEIRRPVLGKNIRGSNRFNQYVQHELGPREGCFIGNPADLETILEIAQERIGLYKEPGLSDKDRKWRHDKLPQDGKLAAQLRRFGVNTNVTKGDASRIYAHKEALTYMRRKGIVD